MNERMIPEDGRNPYADHPGFEAHDCALRYTVTPTNPHGVLGACGFGCEMTGGHCVPGEHCAGLRERAARHDELQRMLRSNVAIEPPYSVGSNCVLGVLVDEATKGDAP